MSCWAFNKPGELPLEWWFWHSGPGGLGRSQLCQWRGLVGLLPELIPLGCGELGGTAGSGCVCSVFLAFSSLVPTLDRGSAPHRDVAEVPVPRS